MAKARVDVRIFSSCVPVARSDVISVIHRIDQCKSGVAGALDVSQANLAITIIFGSRLFWGIFGDFLLPLPSKDPEGQTIVDITVVVTFRQE